jgi:hypothetical protein
VEAAKNFNPKNDSDALKNAKGEHAFHSSNQRFE